MKKRSKFFKVSVAILLLFFIWIAIAPFLANFLIIEKPLEKADAIFVLGGSAVYIERTNKAASLYRRGVAPKIVLTDDGKKAGWSQTEQRNPPFVDLAKKVLMEQGVPENAIEIIKPDVSGTFSEAEILQEKVKNENLKSLLIVTSAYHSRRSLWIFERVFAEKNLQIKIGIEPSETGQQTPMPFTWWLTPRGWNLVAGEYVKFLYYWIYY